MITTMGPTPEPEADPDPRELLSRAIDYAGSASAAARLLEFSPAYILAVHDGRRPASKRLLDALGLERRIVRKVDRS